MTFPAAHSPTAAVLSAAALWGALPIFCPEERVGEAAGGLERPERNKSGFCRCRSVGCMRPERLTFPVISEQQDRSSASSVSWTETPRGSLKVHFFKKYFTSRCPPLNHMCFAISSSSTRSNFAVEKKRKKKSIFLFSFLLLRFPHRNTSTNKSSGNSFTAAATVFYYGLVLGCFFFFFNQLPIWLWRSATASLNLFLFNPLYEKSVQVDHLRLLWAHDAVTTLNLQPPRPYVDLKSTIHVEKWCWRSLSCVEMWHSVVLNRLPYVTSCPIRLNIDHKWRISISS